VIRRSNRRRWSAWSLPVLVLLTACTVSVRVGSVSPSDENAYRAAIQAPITALNNAATLPNDTCAGGAHPNQAQCYSGTQAEIAATQNLEKALRAAPTPVAYAKANADMIRGLDTFERGLSQRNLGLMHRSDAEYAAGDTLIDQGLAFQKTAISEYPSDAGITF
jgi:hypothetical protein